MEVMLQRNFQAVVRLRNISPLCTVGTKSLVGQIHAPYCSRMYILCKSVGVNNHLF